MSFSLPAKCSQALMMGYRFSPANSASFGWVRRRWVRRALGRAVRFGDRVGLRRELSSAQRVRFDPVGFGPGGVVGAEGFDDGAVGFDEVDASGPVAFAA